MLTPDWRPQVDSVRVMRMNLPEWPYILLGLLGSIVMGGAMPVYAILFGEVIHPHIYTSTYLHIYPLIYPRTNTIQVLGVLKLPPDQAREDSVYYCSLFVAAGVTAAVAVFLQVMVCCPAAAVIRQDEDVT